MRDDGANVVINSIRTKKKRKKLRGITDYYRVGRHKRSLSGGRGSIFKRTLMSVCLFIMLGHRIDLFESTIKFMVLGT